MGLFDILKSAKNSEIDYERLANEAEAQACIYGQGQMFITNGGTGGSVLSGGGGGGGGSAIFNTATPLVNQHTQEYSDVGLIFMRLRGGTNGSLGAYPKLFDYIAAHRYAEGKVAVFVCNDGGYVVLEDNTDLFPSDALITQLRMIQK